MNSNIKIIFYTVIAIMLVCTLSVLLFFLLYPVKYKSYIVSSSAQFNVSASLVASVINCESSYNPLAISSSGAIGLMQIMPATGEYLADRYGLEEFVIDDLYDIQTNITLGSYYLSILLNEFDDLKTTLVAYNAGPTKARTWLLDTNYSQNGTTLDTTPYPVTNNYVDKVISNINMYKKFYSS